MKFEENLRKERRKYHPPQFVFKAICKQIRNNGTLDCLSHDENPSLPLITPITHSPLD